VIIIGLGWDSFVYAVDKRTSLAALTRPIIAAPVSRGHGDVLARAERSRRRLSAGFPADAQMPTAWALREPGAALGEILPV